MDVLHIPQLLPALSLGADFIRFCQRWPKHYGITSCFGLIVRTNHRGQDCVILFYCGCTNWKFEICTHICSIHTRTHTHTHTFSTPLSRTTRVSRYQKGKTNLDFTEARDSEWQWHLLGHMQVCISLQADNHASIPPLSFFTGRMPFLLPNQQHQSTEGNICSIMADKP